MKWLATMVSLMQSARDAMFPREKMQTPKRQTRFTYTDGPMFYIGQQIVKAMQDAGYPAKISECYRSPERQNQLFAKRTSKARAWQSPHQFLEAVDIIHPSKGWNVSQEYWDTLNACARIVEEKYNVQLTYGYDWGWDMAHIELTDWKTVKTMKMNEARKTGERIPPTPRQLWDRFKVVLPGPARQHMKAVGFSEPSA